jgi:tetratricopeptide (TPR) repeat protein
VSTGFSTQDVTGMLGLSPARLRAYIKAGLLCPQRGSAGELRVAFQDLLLLRKAEGLVTERLPPRRVLSALRHLRRLLPASQPLTGVHLGNEGGHVVVVEGDRSWQADSGQMLIPYGQAGGGAATAVLALRPPLPLPDDADLQAPTADEFYAFACSLEEGAPLEAQVAYERVLKLDPQHADAHINLGRMLHDAGDLVAAERHYRAAIAAQPKNATALYNLGVLLEDRAQPEAAIMTYESATSIDPRHADAHFNAARLHDLAGHYEAALRHLRAYRNLTNG